MGLGPLNLLEAIREGAAMTGEGLVSRPTGQEYRIGVIIVTYAISPDRLVASIRSRHKLEYKVFHHGEKCLEVDIRDCFIDLNASIEFCFENRGLSKSWNDGIVACRSAGCDFILIINDDVMFKEGAFDAWLEFLIAHPGHGVGFVHGDEPQEGGGFITRSQDFACFSLGEAAIQNVGAFDEAFVPAYFEDFDYMARILETGVGIVCEERPLVIHERSQSVRESEKLRAELPVFFARNREYFIRKWGAESPSARVFKNPFNDPSISVFIPFATRQGERSGGA